MERDQDGNVRRSEGFKQVCVWPGTLVAPHELADFIAFFKDQMNTEIQYLEEIITVPTFNGDGGRVDVLFAVRAEDVGHFAIPRLQLGVKWIEDFVANGHLEDYDTADAERVQKYRIW